MYVSKIHTHMPAKDSRETVRLEHSRAKAEDDSEKIVSLKWTKRYTDISRETRGQKSVWGFYLLLVKQAYLGYSSQRNRDKEKVVWDQKVSDSSEGEKVYPGRERRLEGRKKHLHALVWKLREKMQGKNQKISTELELDLGILMREDQLLSF